MCMVARVAGAQRQLSWSCWLVPPNVPKGLRQRLVGFRQQSCLGRRRIHGRRRSGAGRSERLHVVRVAHLRILTIPSGQVSTGMGYCSARNCATQTSQTSQTTCTGMIGRRSRTTPTYFACSSRLLGAGKHARSTSRYTGVPGTSRSNLRQGDAMTGRSR